MNKTSKKYLAPVIDVVFLGLSDVILSSTDPLEGLDIPGSWH